MTYYFVFIKNDVCTLGRHRGEWTRRAIERRFGSKYSRGIRNGQHYDCCSTSKNKYDLFLSMKRAGTLNVQKVMEMQGSNMFGHLMWEDM